MRTVLTAAALLVAATLVPLPVTAEQPTCDPNPLTQGHPGWINMPTTEVDLRTPPPATATNPLLQAFWRVLPAPGLDAGTGSVPVNPLTNRP